MLKTLNCCRYLLFDVEIAGRCHVLLLGDHEYVAREGKGRKDWRLRNRVAARNPPLVLLGSALGTASILHAMESMTKMRSLGVFDG